MPDLIETHKRDIARRLKELRPLLQEYERLEAAAKALDSIPAARSANTGEAARRATAAPAKPAAKRRGGRRAGRPPGSGGRAIEALALITAQPGISTPELAERMGIQANYLYRVLPALQKAGKVTKKGKGWHAR
jgi:hypothetical protein